MVARAFVAPEQTRPRPGPPAFGTTLMAVGDVHAGSCPSWRMDAVAADALTAPGLPTPSTVIQLGDNVDNVPSTQEPLFKQFMDRLSPDWHNVMGNHDIQNDVQTPAQWAASYGHPAQSYIVDLPGLRLVMFSPSTQWSNYTHVPADALAWLDEAISGTTDPVIICCHFPLYDTVGGDPTLDYVSTQTSFYIRTDAINSSAPILDVIAAHGNVVAWIAGHTHSCIDVPGLVIPVTAGSVRFASINTSCLWYCGKTVDPAIDLIHTMYVTWLDDQIEVRPRNHGGRAWGSVHGQRVLRVTGLG